MAVTRMEILKLYKQLLRESSKFSSYNFRYFNSFSVTSKKSNLNFINREYAFMRVKDAFRENKNLTDATTVEKQVAKGYKNLNIIKRQV
jgi:hypothetical protein